jgi:hypothetical protein
MGVQRSPAQASGSIHKAQREARKADKARRKETRKLPADKQKQ